MFHCFVKDETDLFMINIFNLRNSAIATIFPHFCRMVHISVLKEKIYFARSKNHLRFQPKFMYKSSTKILNQNFQKYVKL